MTADFLIVGQGVAGSVLAWTLDRRGCRVVVANDPARPAASAVAAGIVNPLTGRKLHLTWEADRLFPFLHDFYTGVEHALGVQFFHPLDIYRPYRSETERSAYQQYAQDPAVARYVRLNSDDATYRPDIINPFGGMEVTGGGWVDLPEFINVVKGYFLRRGQYAEVNVTPDDLRYLSPDEVLIDDLRVRTVIFCDGPAATENSLFSYLPFNPVKGQLLTVEIPGYNVRNVVNQGVWILPVRNNVAKIGATYSWHDLDWQTTDDGRQFLESKVAEVLALPYKVLRQQAGIRPAVKDRRPLLGRHPAQPAVAIFGGLGTKGVSLAPLLAAQLADHLLDGKDLDPAVNIQRFESVI